ncbi:MAG: putative DNA binding domain-containing protein [Oscillospiraceae bacterium]|nr:putative DNA binding domain-containing protein [Oscillospiraceae bacterium]
MTLHEILNATEGDHFEFKEAKTRYDFGEAVKYCCALANCGGGKFILGITDKRPRKVVGSNAFEQPERTCKGLMDKLRVRVDFQLYEHEGKRVLVFEVACRPVGLPVQADGIAWWRDGDSLVPIPEDVRRKIYIELEHDFSSEICADVTLADLDSAALNKFRMKWSDHTRNRRIISLSDEQLLRDCGAVTDKGITYAALILFGKRAILQKRLPHSEVIFEYRSKEAAGPAAQREEFQEGFFSYDDRIWELVNLRNDEQHYRDKLYRHPVPTFNEDVVREAVLNAVSHRDYQMGGSIFVRQYQNRFVVESPGGFPHGITVENILNRQNARNRLIANIFRLCGLVERSGQGMNLIYETAIKEAKPLPDFSGSDAFFVMLTLKGKVIDGDMLAFIRKIDDERLNAMTTNDYLLLGSLFTRNGNDGCIDRAKFEHLAELEIVRFTERGTELITNDTTTSIECQSTAAVDWQSIDISDRKKQILNFIAENGKATTLQLTKITGLTQGRIRTILQELAADGLVVKEGDYRYASYTVRLNPPHKCGDL